jgi:hypothetical protein
MPPPIALRRGLSIIRLSFMVSTSMLGDPLDAGAADN